MTTRRRTPPPETATIVPFRPRPTPSLPAPSPDNASDVLRRLCGVLVGLGEAAAEIRNNPDMFRAAEDDAPIKPAS